MFTDVTYQDWESTPESSRPEAIENIITKYKAKHDFIHALDGNAYFDGANTNVGRKTILQADVVTKTDKETGRTKRTPSHKEVVGNRLANNFFFRFVSQQNQYLLGNGLLIDGKEKLGEDFDHVLAQIGENALKQGVCWGFYNVDHIEMIEAAKDIYSGFVALLDEVTSIPRVGIQFWQLNSERPLCVRLFEEDGVTLLSKTKNGNLTIREPKRSYKLDIVTDAVGSEIVCESNYGVLPIIPMYANTNHQSELTDGLKAKIDAYDNIVSDLADNLDRANDVYWVLNNFGGSTDDVLMMLEQMNRIKAVVSQTDGMGGGSSAEPKTIEVPYQARQTALELLRKSLYQDYMALDMNELTGGSLTNVAIKASTANLDLKADRYEWQVRRFVRGICRIAGVDASEIHFKRSEVYNDSEVIANIYQMRSDIDLRTALELNPYIDNDAIDQIIANKDAEGQTGMESIDELQKIVDGMDQQDVGADA